jgi:hypothetical protein
MSPLATLRNIRANFFGKRDGKAFSKKHASLAYLTVPPFPKELAERYRRALEAHLHRYQAKRARLEEKLIQVRHLRQSLERVVGQDEPTPEVFSHMLAFGGRYALMGLIFSAELVFNKLAADTLGVNQLEAYIIGFIATLIMFWMGHEAGNQFRKGQKVLAGILLSVPLLMAVLFALLRAEFTQRMAQIVGAPASHWTLAALIALGLGLVAFTFFLGFKAPHERETLFRRYLMARNREKHLMGRLLFLHRQARKVQDYAMARYREEVAAYWRGFARAWPDWDPAPEFVGALPPLEPPKLPPEPPGPESLDEPAKMPA